jgi:hypothetical protein
MEQSLIQESFPVIVKSICADCVIVAGSELSFHRLSHINPALRWISSLLPILLTLRINLTCMGIR